LHITIVPCLEDNYAYLLDDGSGELAVVDPSEAKPVLEALDALREREGRGATLRAILATHHHHDHVGGNLELVQRFPGLRVLGYKTDRGRIPGQTEFLEDGETFSWGQTAVRALHIPGHTLGAVGYVAAGAVFTGDTLFAAGCGRLFEGTPAMMHRSLCDVLAPLGAEVRVYCGHEYTIANLQFAQTVEPTNGDVTERLARARAARERGEPTMGETIGEELATNPFLRASSPELRRGLGLGQDATNVEVFTALRRAKDAFRAPR
jgi:hydroxyacylglutathione hydrolase